MGEYSQTASTPFERILALDIAGYIDSEMRESTLGSPLVVEGDGRFIKSGRVTSNSQLLRDIHIDSSTLEPQVVHILYIAKDTIALTDSAGMPIRVAEYRGEADNTGAADLRRAITTYESPYSLVLDTCGVFDPKQEADPLDTKMIEMANLFGVSPTYLCNYLKTTYDISAFQAKVNERLSTIQESAAYSNHLQSVTFLEQAISELKNYKGDDEYIRSQTDEAAQAMSEHKIDRAFTCVKSALRRSDIIKVNSLAASVVGLEALHKIHRQSFSNARDQRSKAEKDFEEEERRLVKELNARRDTLDEQFAGREDQILASFKSYVDKIIAPLPVLNWRDYDGGISGCMYEDGVSQRVEETLSLRLDSLTFAVQQRLIKFMLRDDDGSFNRFKAALKAVDVDHRNIFAEAFLATEFGDDFGDQILSIAEHADAEQAHEIFETVNAFRERSKDFASWFRDYDPEFTEATERAMNERLTDALYAIEVLAREGTLNVDTAPRRHNEDYENDGKFEMKLSSLASGIEILKGLEKSLSLMHKVITAEDVRVSRVVQNTEQFMQYRFSSASEGEAMLYVRPQGAFGYDRQFEYGNRKGVEASISFMTNPAHPHKPAFGKDPEAVSIRFDREGRTVNESPSSEDRDPTRANGSISLDISSGIGDGRHMPVKIGRLIAAGNILRAQNIGSTESLHHNTNFFDQSRYGDAEGFSKLAIYFMHMAEAMISLQQNGSHASGYSTLPGVLSQEVEAIAA